MSEPASSRRLKSAAVTGAALVALVIMATLHSNASADLQRDHSTALRPLCDGEVVASLVNRSSAVTDFKVEQAGSAPAAEVSLGKGTTDIHLPVPAGGAIFAIRAGDSVVTNAFITHEGPCSDPIIGLPTVETGKSAVAVIDRACGAFAVTTYANGTGASQRYEVKSKGDKDPLQSVTISDKVAAAITVPISRPDRLTVTRGGDVQAAAEVTPKGPCVDVPGQAGLALSTFAWGNPVRVDDFNAPGTPTGPPGWQPYDDPTGRVPRSRNQIKLVKENGVSEMQLTGLYDKSAGLHTGSGAADTFNQQYGRWVVRARSDRGSGFAPTILLWPKGDHWPAGGEIDLLEAYKGDRKNAIGAIHNGSKNQFITQGMPGDQSEWHEYAVDWFPDHATFYVDNTEFWTVRDPKYIPTTDPMHLVVQNDAGCGWIACPNSDTQRETSLHIDWIKIYALPHH